MLRIVKPADHKKFSQIQTDEIRRHTLNGVDAKTFQVEYVWVRGVQQYLTVYTVNRFDGDALARCDRKAYIAANSFYDLLREFIRCRF